MTEHVLITGVAGFIGSNLLDFLLENTDWEITGVDNFSSGSPENIAHRIKEKRFRMVEGKCSGLKSIGEYSKIFHLAALPRIQPSFESVTEHIRENVLEGIHLVELMIRDKHFPRLLYSSSSAIYGNPSHFPTKETEPVRCMNPYAFQKYEFEKYLDILSMRYPLDYVHLRYFNPYGPRSYNPSNRFNAYSSVVGIFLHQYREGKKLQITGDGKQSRDFIHVADVVRANLLGAKYPGKLNLAFNIGKGKTLTVLELAKMISNDIEFIPPRDGEAAMTLADVSLAGKSLGWVPELELEDYLKNECRQ